MEQIPITPTQREFLKTVKRLTKEQGGVAPSCDELAEALSRSQNSVVTMIQRLIKRGHLTRTGRMHRTLRVVEKAQA
jgi:Mn-dependent DtxR family transcriptional regulator